jgi:hypothetical protein
LDPTLQIKHHLGLLKYRILSETFGRYLASRSKTARERAQAFLPELPPLNGEGQADIEVHMLCGAKQIDMGIFASWSILRFAPDAAFYLHGDPSLRTKDLDQWKRAVPNLIFIDSTQGDAAAKLAISGLPHLESLRANHPLARKLIDPHLFGECNQLLMTDSDVLAFRKPNEVLTKLLDSSTSSCFWNEDIRSSYVCDPSILSKVCGRVVPEKVNAGFLLASRLKRSDFEAMDEWIRVLIEEHGVCPKHCWLEQSLYAMIATKMDRAGAFSSAYRMLHGPSPAGQTVRHYPGNAMIRPLFWLEGFPKLLNLKTAH